MEAPQASASPFRIAIDGRFIDDAYPGVGRYTFQLTQALAQLKIPERLTLLVHPRRSDQRFALEDLGDGIELSSIPSPPRSLREQRDLPRWAAALQPALLHSPYCWSSWRLPCPRILTVHDLIPWLDRRFVASPAARLALRCFVPLLVRRAAMVLTVSQAVQRELCARWRVAPEKIVVTPEAADVRFRPVGEDAVAAMRQRMSLDRPYVLFFGVDRPHKNLACLIAAWVEVQSRLGSVELVVAGAHDLRFPDNRMLARRLGARVRFLGPVAEVDLPALYGGARCLAVPSLAEGFGLTVLEAMACGAPVLCSGIAVLREVTADAALHFEPGDTRQLAGLLEQVATDDALYAALSQRSRARAAEFSWRATAERTLDAYRRVLQTPLGRNA